MKRLLLALAAVGALTPAAAQSLQDGTVIAEQTEAVITVVSIDQKKRTVTFRNAKGTVATVDVPPESQNLDRVKAGDRFRVKYVESVAVGIRKGGPPVEAETKDVRLAPKGATPGGVIVQTQTRSVVVDAIDYGSRYVAARSAGGEVLALKVADGVPLEQLSAGDRISVTYTRALAMEMELQPSRAPEKKAPAKSAAKKS
jgi:endonuclease YncB( thermonuclease family)